jgi:lysyl-tRNA synthetase class 2
MKLSEELIIFVAKKVNGTTITHFNGHEIDLSKWRKLRMVDAIMEFWPSEFGEDPDASAFANHDNMLAWMTKAVQQAKPGWIADPNLQGRAAIIPQLFSNFVFIATQLKNGKIHYGSAIAEVFELLSEPHLIQPTIIYDFPLAVSPLSKKKPNEPDWVERFEFYIGGFEVGNAFSELNDPDDQRARFEQQMTDKERGDHEAHQMDEDYVRALGYGLPPTAGEGIGIDRLTMILTNSKSIRDVILFPLLRPQTKQAETGEGKHGESAE